MSPKNAVVYLWHSSPLDELCLQRSLLSVEEWKDAITTLRNYASEFEGMCDEVLARLKLSYDHLPNETHKFCFRYYAIFPEDHSIQIAKLVDYWIAEGFLDRFDKLDEARNRGHTIIGSLKSACLLESDGEDGVKMHDVIRDLALWIVNDCRSSDASDNNSDNKFLVAVNDPCNKKWKNAEKIFWNANGATRRSSNEEENSPTSRNLLTLIVQKTVIGNGYYSLPQSFFQHMPLLRVLDFSHAHYFDGEFPISICELHELQFLNLSGTNIEKLPIELRKLVKLKFLVLRNTSKLRRIPAWLIANLSELQVLDLGCDLVSNFGVENWELEDGPSCDLSKKKQLQEVRITVTTYVAFDNFLCNQKLQMVCTGLRFWRSYKSLTLSSSSRIVLNLGNFKSLKDLEFIRGFSETEELVILYGSTTYGGMFSYLERLTLGGFCKLKSIIWMAVAAQPDLLRSHFQRLHHIMVFGCDALKDLTWLVYVQNLKELVVGECKGLETIIELDDDGLEGTSRGGDQMLKTGGGGRGVFRRLEILHLHDLPKLKSICSHALAFPSVKTIKILECRELKKLPLNSSSNVNNTLQRIEGSTKWWNELQWEDETIKSKFLPYFRKED